MSLLKWQNSLIFKEKLFKRELFHKLFSVFVGPYTLNLYFFMVPDPGECSLIDKNPVSQIGGILD